MTARVDLGAIRSNFDVIRSLAGDRTLMACIKSNAYGHGLVPVACCLEDAGVPGLTLGSPDEPLARRRAGIATPALFFPAIRPRSRAASSTRRSRLACSRRTERRRSPVALTGKATPAYVF